MQAYAGAGTGSPGHSTPPAVAGILVRRQAGKAGVCRALIVAHAASPHLCVHEGSSGPLCGTGSVVSEQAIAHVCYVTAQCMPRATAGISFSCLSLAHSRNKVQALRLWLCISTPSPHTRCSDYGMTRSTPWHHMRTVTNIQYE